MNIQKQHKYDTMYMDVAHRISEMSYCDRRKVGAIVVESGNIISFGWNGQPANTPNRCEDETNTTYPTVIHAEHNAIEKIRHTSLAGKQATLFVTLMPCAACADKIIEFGIRRVVYRDKYRLLDGIERLVHNGVIVEQLVEQNNNKGHEI